MRATTRNDSASFEMVQFMATAGGLDAWFFNALPSASIFQFSSERAWHHGTKKNHSGGDESFDIRTVFSQVVEFEDVDGDGAFDKKHDKVLQRCRLNEADFSAAAGGFPDPFQPAFQQTKITFPGTNVSGYKLSTKGKLGQKVWPPHGPWPGPGPKPKPHGGGGGDDNDCAGTVQIDYFLTTAAAFDGEVYLSPTSTKFAFSVDGFKYVKPKPPPPAPNGSSSNTSTPETLLALKMFVLSQTIQSDWEFHARGSDHGNMPNIASRTKDKTRQGGFFSWNGTYAGDGRYHEIKTTYAVTTDGGGDFDIASDQTAAELWFTFSGGAARVDLVGPEHRVRRSGRVERRAHASEHCRDCARVACRRRARRCRHRVRRAQVSAREEEPRVAGVRRQQFGGWVRGDLKYSCYW